MGSMNRYHDKVVEDFKIVEDFKFHVYSACRCQCDFIREAFVLASPSGALEFRDNCRNQIIHKYQCLFEVPHFLHCYGLIDESLIGEMFEYAREDFLITCESVLKIFYDELERLRRIEMEV